MDKRKLNNHILKLEKNKHNLGHGQIKGYKGQDLSPEALEKYKKRAHKNSKIAAYSLIVTLLAPNISYGISNIKAPTLDSNYAITMEYDKQDNNIIEKETAEYWLTEYSKTKNPKQRQYILENQLPEYVDDIIASARNTVKKDVYEVIKQNPIDDNKEYSNIKDYNQLHTNYDYRAKEENIYISSLEGDILPIDLPNSVKDVIRNIYNLQYSTNSEHLGTNAEIGKLEVELLNSVSKLHNEYKLSGKIKEKGLFNKEKKLIIDDEKVKKIDENTQNNDRDDR